MARRAPNRARNADVSLSHREQLGPAVQGAQDLTEGQLWLLLLLALRNGGHPADRCKTLWGFEPTPAERDAIELRIDQRRGVWQPWIALEVKRCPP